MNNHSDRSTGDIGQDLLTITEAAHLLRTPVATLRYWRHIGTGPRSFNSAAASSPPGPISRRGSLPKPRPRVGAVRGDHAARLRH